MKYKIKEPKFFYDCLSIVDNMVNEAFMEMDENGILSYGIGPSRIVIYHLQIGEEVKDGEIFAFNCYDFDKVLSRVKAAEELILEYMEEDRKVKLVAKYGEDKKTFILNTVNPEVGRVPYENLRSLPYSVILQIKANDLMNVVNDCKIFSDLVTFEISKKDKIKLGAASVNGRVVIEKAANVLFMEEQQTLNPTYGVKFLDMIFGHLGNRSINILLGLTEADKSLPMFCQLEVSPKHKLMTWIAPRVKDEML